MQKLEDSFDGTFNENIRSNTYKAQNANKKNKVIINVNCKTFLINRNSIRSS
jgi:hypothetical protein